MRSLSLQVSYFKRAKFSCSAGYIAVYRFSVLNEHSLLISSNVNAATFSQMTEAVQKTNVNMQC